MASSEGTHNSRRWLLVPLLVALVMVAIACSSGGSSGGSSASSSVGDPNTDKLAQVLARGTLILSTDPAYPPQSYAVKGATRLSDTKCAPNQMTANQIAGYDADIGKLVAKALGVEPCFVAPTWTEVTGGNWNDRWDVSWGSGAINTDRMERLWMTQPYRAEPQIFFVKKDSPYQAPGDLDGKSVGACTSCTVEYYLEGSLQIPNLDLPQKVKDPKVVLFETEWPGLKAASKGKLDAYLAAQAVGEQAIKEGMDLRPLKEEAFTMYLTGFLDKSSAYSQTAFAAKIDQVVSGLLADGSLKALSMKYFGKDYATASSDYDFASLNQQIP